MRVTQLKTSRFLLKSPVEEDDFDEITKIKSDPKVYRTQLYGQITTLEYCRFMFQHYITDARTLPARRKRWVFGIYPLEISPQFPKRKYIGNVGISKKTLSSETAHLFFEVSPDYWGLGVATECVSKAMEFAFQQGARKIVVDPMHGNEASKKVAIKLGFHDTGRSVPTYTGCLKHIYVFPKPKATKKIAG
ncbi:N-acetyltransferase [Schizosaccharomyces cryophilus OY26]|uniref:N-acetyltransferase n=1 Tax=Schizosaccharomyces cryophilus (strain OY26 / ATCC MYA-4695 / CBS 11777 / NBRC 106824 / NRRL Y48691) TaxID=653667 RepID=S9VTW4_SCHCR|nr:N-acetyltransferase [Schizosaccharomyces cryophilus OY26]EPY49614.1 N-acetyltransferase [Schizosaccharomyces cryophilus OY26]